MSGYQCYPNFLQYQNAVSSGQTASAAALLQALCANKCYEAIPSINCAALPTPTPVTPPAVITPPIDNCAQYQSAYSDALARGDGIGQLNAANGLCTYQCPMPARWHCGATGAYWNPDPSSTTPPATTPDITPTHTPPPAPSKCDVLTAAYLMAKSQNNGAQMTGLVLQLCAADCQMPAGTTCPRPASDPICQQYTKAFTDALAAKNLTGAKAALDQLCAQGCPLPVGMDCGWDPSNLTPWNGGDPGHGPVVTPGGHTFAPPSVNPCTGEQALTLVDYLINLPLSGIKTDPILAIVFSAAGGIGGGVIAFVFVPEGGKWVRIPAAVLGVYGGLIVNGILANWDWFKNAEKYGLVFGSIITGIGALSGMYQSIHGGTEKFLKTELGGAVGEVVFKVGESFFTGGLAPLYDIAFGDKTWTTAGYNKAKCEAGCDNPKLSSIERKMCKLGARLDLKF